MISFENRPAWLNWQFGQRTQFWQRLSRWHISLIVSSIICFFGLLLFVFSGPSKSKINQPSPPPPELPKHNHPILNFVAAANYKHQKLVNQQSQSLAEAVKQYKSRYNISPPPHFDKWHAFAEEHNIPLRDEYDDIFNDLRPFWGSSPAVIRKHVATAIATNDYITGVSIRGGKVTITERGEQWRRDGINSAIEPFAYLLPDMDIAFNRHDEPRTIIPHDQLAQLYARADQHLSSHSLKRKGWSSPPPDLDDSSANDIRKSPFFEAEHPFTWEVSTLSCPPESPARLSNYDDIDHIPDSRGYSSEPINFMEDRAAATDVCSNPFLKDIHSIFISPNTWSVTHQPIPIFSPSKISTFHDVLFPAPWYLAGKANYDQNRGIPWNEKADNLYWRGTTTSGYSQGGIWRLQPRQRFVESVERSGKTHILTKAQNGGDFLPQEIDRETYHHYFDVHFSMIDNCSGEDCAAQHGFFNVRYRDPYEENWKHRFLLDIDGNAFSGRFYSFLQSQSLTLKYALFREWHEARLTPWAHYIPLGFHGSDHFEIMRFLNEDDEGNATAQEIAKVSTEWANQSLRHVDMQAWVFRLLLEYARLVDDNRDELGYE